MMGLSDSMRDFSTLSSPLDSGPNRALFRERDKYLPAVIMGYWVRYCSETRFAINSNISKDILQAPKVFIAIYRSGVV